MRLNPWPRQAVKEKTKEAVSLDYDSREERLKPWSRALRHVRLSRALLNLMWTAGPVTGLGLTGGYFVAYGRPPSAELLLYFATFTVLSGLIALVAKVVYDSTWGPSKERAEAEVLATIDQLGDLIVAVRDLNVESLEGNARRSEAARQLLRRVELSPQGVALACEDLTNDRELGRILARIDNYRRAGLYSRIRDLNTLHSEYFEATLERLRVETPLAASALRDRFYGDVPRLRAGIPRNDAFIERALAAFEEKNPLLLTMGDVEDMLGLAFELINGREIPILTFTYGGRWRFAKALDQLETARSRYRLAIAASDNRIRALANFLIETNHLAYEAAPEELPIGTLLERVTATMNTLQEQIDERCRTYRSDPVLTRHARETLTHDAATLATAVSLYRAARTAVQSLGTSHAELLRASQSWDRLMNSTSGDTQRLRIGSGKQGLRIVERTIQLDEEAREDVCQRVMNHLRGDRLDWRGRQKVNTGPVNTRRLTSDYARHLAVEVAIALEPHIELSRPEVQRGLAATNASYLGDLEPGMSAQEKRSLGQAMAQDVEHDLGRAAEQLAVALVRHYHVELPEAAQSFLEELYGARPQILGAISRSQTSDQTFHVSLLSRRPTPVPEPNRNWYRSLVRARRVLR